MKFPQACVIITEIVKQTRGGRLILMDVVKIILTVLEVFASVAMIAITLPVKTVAESCSMMMPIIWTRTATRPDATHAIAATMIVV